MQAWSPEDCCKTCKVIFTEAYLELSWTYMMELFSLQLNHILKTYLIGRIAFRLHFLRNSVFRQKKKNLQLWQLLEKKPSVNNRTIFLFKIRNYAMEWRHQQRFLKLASVKSIETATLFSFVIISNIMVKTFFQEQRGFI